MMNDTIHCESTFKNRRYPRVWITLVMDYDPSPPEAIPRIWYDSGSIKSQPFRGVMGRDDISVISSHRVSNEGFRAGKNCAAIWCGREIVDAGSRM